MSSNIAVFTSHTKALLSKIIAMIGLMIFVANTSLGQSSEQADVENIIITATKRESTLQEAPLAVNAFSGGTLSEKGIDDTSDLQFNVPNMLFTKTNFTGANLAIRGIGNNAVAASSDSGTGVHFNGAYLVAPALFETEFYDVNRVEVLRGPQGTLYGRNTTAGVLNIIPNKPQADGYHGEAKLESTDYNGRRLTSVANLPIIKNFLQLRIASQSHKRDGVIFNEHTENFIDDRDTRSFRSSIRIGGGPDSWFDLTVIRERFNEEDSRLRTSKQVCHKDFSAASNNLGCRPGQSLYSDDAFSTPSSTGTLAGFIASVYPHAVAPTNPSSDTFLKFLLPNSLLNGGIDANLNCEVYGTSNCRYDRARGLDYSKYDSTKDGNADDLRSINENFDPYYRNENDLRVATLDIDLGDAFTLSMTGAEQEGFIHTNTDYNHAVSTYKFDEAATAATNRLFTGGAVTTGAFLFTTDPVSTGHGQNVNNRDTLVGFDVSTGNSMMSNTEVKLVSNFDGGFNFIIGAFDLEYSSNGVYEVHSNGLAFLSAADPARGYYQNHTESYNLTSEAVYGEAYFEGQAVRLTLGYRTSDETKATSSRQTLLNNAANQFLPGISGVGSLNNASNIFAGFAGNGNSAIPDYTVLNGSWSEPSSKVSIDFLGDNSLLFITYANSYKSGGLNPPAFTGAFKQTFDPEYINSLEIGGKSSYGIGNKSFFNWTLFHYDYEGLQTSKIIDRTSVNENINATNQGMELEWNHFFTPNFAATVTISSLNTEIANGESINTADPANYYAYYDVQDDGSVALKNAAVAPRFINTKNSDASVYLTPNTDNDTPFNATADCGALMDGGRLECVSVYNSRPDLVVLSGNTSAQDAASYNATTPVFYNSETNQYYVSTNDATYNQAVTIEDLVGVTGTYSDRLPTKSLVPLGIAIDLTGNQLPNAPEASSNVNLKWLGELDGNKLAFNIEYYWQSDFYTRTYNTQQDLVQAWDVVNMSLSLTDKKNQWSINFYVKNAADKDYITGTYFTDASSGNFTNVFLLEPKTYGANLRVNF